MTQHNKSINSNIEEFLNYYCGLSHAPGFAVLLKGPWGSGKTWFIKKYITKLTEQKQKYLYVSLNGISSFSEIEEAFLVQQIPLLASKPVAIGRNLVTQVLKGTFKIDFGSDKALSFGIPNASLTEYLTNVSESILIFDDLERCDIDLSKILGYINNFVEHKELKVIIVANEDILVEKNSEYKAIKEKLISQTFDVSPDFERALENFVQTVKASATKTFLFENIKLIQDVYEKAQYKNLRTLNKIVLDLERIFEFLPQKAKNKPELLQDIFNLLMFFSIEIKRGEILTKDIAELGEKQLSIKSKQIRKAQRALDSTVSEDDARANSLERIFGRYASELNLYESVPGIKWWQLFFDKGIIDAQELNDSISNSKYFEDENTAPWIKLWHYHHLDDNDFDDLLEKVESEYKNRSFDDLGVVKHITGLFLKLSAIEVYSKSKEDILRDAKLYIDSLQLKNYSNSLYENMFGGYLGLAFQGEKLEEFKEFCSYVKQSTDSATNMDSRAQELLVLMRDDTLKFGDIIAGNNSHNWGVPGQIYSQIPILKHIQEVDFVNEFLLLKFPYKDAVCRTLTRRYEFNDFNEKLFEELDWLKSVQSLLLKEVDRRRGKITGYTLKLLIEQDFDQAIQRLEATKLD
ncbi:putative P-loop ATPase, KAP-like [Nostoc flagelliforme CCNUN1]|uniref:Putative P-loop ATPase, KAP-like n=1 Tax=Nostoc flagelliforme CCNUN1 TaxID=2038116 RepID=A0A2K8T362_9NOSO|nr:P-loop NTPase fold protein [Nostoc flagelliforme]AUB42134.1 putative P-loop ATPase, KAP-like [Nostoc flagelliforme CCNUN1]